MLHTCTLLQLVKSLLCISFTSYYLSGSMDEERADDNKEGSDGEKQTKGCKEHWII